ncbi:hypothetical protein T484DRAFT_1768494 [Baffinella frigidus]|nr:hypothetical protein T484DRAFT_1768494 [Cryptophyta sp. CCMP2293]
MALGSESPALAAIERAALLGLEEATSTLCHLPLLLRSHLNMAEVRFLQGHRTLAMSHFTECRDLVFALVVSSPHIRFALADGHVGSARSALGTLNRLARFLLALDTATINRNLAILDAILQLEADLGSLLQRQQATYLPATLPADLEADLGSLLQRQQAGAPASETGQQISTLLHCIQGTGRLWTARKLARDEVSEFLVVEVFRRNPKP